MRAILYVQKHTEPTSVRGCASTSRTDSDPHFARKSADNALPTYKSKSRQKKKFVDLVSLVFIFITQKLCTTLQQIVLSINESNSVWCLFRSILSQQW